MEKVCVPSRTQAVRLTEDNTGEVLAWLRSYLSFEDVREAWTANGLRVGRKSQTFAGVGDWVVFDALTNKAYVVFGETNRAIALGLEDA